jgi:two-component sensor histidine kinase
VDATIATGEVISLALALHELATNALRYGALSSERGRVSLKVDDVGDRLLMTWKEHGGSEVQQPQTRGFGSRLLQRSGMDTKLVFEADGLLCSMGLRKSLR